MIALTRRKQSSERVIPKKAVKLGFFPRSKMTVKNLACRVDVSLLYYLFMCPLYKYLNFPYTYRQTTKLRTVFERACVTKTKKKGSETDYKGTCGGENITYLLTPFFGEKKSKRAVLYTQNPTSKI